MDERAARAWLASLLFWEDYAYAQPSLTQKKLRLLELRASSPSRKGQRTGLWATNQAMRKGERELATQGEAAEPRLTRNQLETSFAATRAFAQRTST